MQQTFTFKQKLIQFMNILLPILITQIGLFAMNFFDIMMSGHASPQDLAGVAIGTGLWIPVFTGLSGVLLAMTPIVAQLVGAKKDNMIAFSTMQGIYVSILFAILVMVVGGCILEPVLRYMSLEPNVHTIAKHYLVGLAFGIIPLFVYTVLRSCMDALGMTRITMLITLTALPINILFNYMLIFGKLGFPALGGVGAGYATSITYWCITFITVLIMYTKEPFTRYELLRQAYPFSLKAWKELLLIGIPIGFAIFFETSIFSAVTLLMSAFNTITIASHQAAINFASFLYMIPMSISMALTIVIGFEVGARRYSDAKQYTVLGVSLAVMMSGFCAIFLYFFKLQVASLYTKDLEVLQLTSHFLVYAIFFQLSDAIAAPIQGALRGYKDVNITLIMAFVSYWILGLPLGYILANYTSYGAFGYWIGLISGLAAGAICLSYRLVSIQRSFKQQ